MEGEPIREPKLESQDVEAPTVINPKPPRKLREFEAHNAANPSARAKRFKGALLAVQKPSYCLKRGVGSLQWGGESLRFQHRTRLFRILSQLLRRHNWAEASGVLSVLLKGTLNDHSISGNRAKYTATLELLSIIKGENFSSKGSRNIYELWIKKLGPLKFWLSKDRFAVQFELILSYLQCGSVNDAYQAALCLMQERGFDGDPVANLVVGLVFCQRWYSDIPEELQVIEFDSSGTYMLPEIPMDGIHMPIDYSEVGNAHESGGANSLVQSYSNTSVANDKEEAEIDVNQPKKSMEIEVKVKNETSCSSYESQDLSCKSSEAVENSGSALSDYNADLPQVSIFHTQGLPPWLFPMKLPSSHDNLEDAIYNHRRLLNHYYDSAVKHLRVALHSEQPRIEAIHPLIQMLILGDQVDEACYELETLLRNSDTVLPLRLYARLLEHFDNRDPEKLAKYLEDILKKDPTCSDSLSKLVLMHRRGEYATHKLAEVLAIRLDASYGTCDTWQEFASCLLRLSQCEGDVESCNGGSDPQSRGCLYNSNQIPELFTCGESGKGWRFRTRWWLNRHFHDRILVSDMTSGDLKLLTYKAAVASHIYGRHLKYVVKATEFLERENDMELYSLLQTHLLNSVGFCIVKGRS